MKYFLSLILFTALFITAKSQSITVTYPNGGDTLFNCNTDTIRFAATGTSTFYNIDYSVNGGTTWQSVITNIKITDGKYGWKVPINVTHSSNCLIKVYDKLTPTIKDSSNAVFNIFKPLVITSPNGGEVLNSYTNKTITWTAYNKSTSNYFSIYLSLDNGSTWSFINNFLNTTTNSYNWVVPTIAANTKCLIKIEDVYNTCKVDISDAAFTINPPKPIIKQAGGGKVFRGGEANIIKWDTASILSSLVRIEYSIDSGKNWILQDSAVKTVGKYNFYVPNISSTKCFIKLLNNTNQSLYTISDTAFTILPTAIIYSPFLHDTFYTCNSTVINFDRSSAYGLYILEYQEKGSSIWKTIGSKDYSSSGTSVAFTWQLPQSLSYALNNDIVIRIYPYNDATAINYSNTFHIKTSISLVTPRFDGHYKSGDTVLIKWNAEGTNNSFDIGASYDAGGVIKYDPKQIVSNYVSATNEYKWIVPNTSIFQGKIGVRDHIDTCKEAKIYSTYTISKLDTAIRLINGNGGDTLTGCSTYNISWKLNSQIIALSWVWDLYYYDVNSFSSHIIVTGLSRTITNYSWTVSDINQDIIIYLKARSSLFPYETFFTDFSDKPLHVNNTGFKAYPQDTIVCYGSSVQLNASTGYTNYTWSPKSGLSDSTIINPIAYVTSTKTYTVKANLGTCVVTDYVNVKRQSEVGISSIAISADTTNICAGKPITVNSNTIYAGANAVYKWFVNKKLKDSTNNSSFTYNFKQNDSVVCVMYSSLCVSNSFAQSNGIKFLFPYTPIVTNSYLAGCNNVTYKGNVYTSSAVVIDTLKFVNGCDSVYNNMNITINLPTTSTTSKIANITYTWNGTTYTSSGTYSKTFIGGSSKGCDSTATLNLTIVASGCWYKISAGVTHVLAIKGDGTLWAWGGNANGQLGNGTTTDKKIPTQIGTASNWASISAGNNYSMAIKTDGTLWAWGYNVDGQLGNGTTTNKTQPTQIGTATNWASVATGEGHTVAIKTDSTLWAWGSNVYGQLGDGTIVNKTSPIQIGTANNWASVTTKSVTTYAIKTNGTLWTWGRNNYGQMGDGTTVSKSTPKQIGTATDWANISAGYSYALATKTNGALWAWGLNNYMQLGDGTSTTKIVPGQIGTVTNWINIASGFDHSIATKTDGTLWAWGSNTFGQLGDGATANRSTPTKIGTQNNWGNVSAGNIYTTATQKDGSVWAWGNNLYYQIGDGTSTDKFVPTLASNCTSCTGVIPTNTTVNLSGCGKVIYNGITYTSNITKLDTIKTVQGCDSLYKTANITITNTPPARDTFATVCSSINWYGTVFTKDTVATHTITNNIASSLNEGFDLGATAPTGWTFPQISGTYTSAGNFGVASPSLKFGASNDVIYTPSIPAPATQLSFWVKSQGANGSSLDIYGFNGTSWLLITTMTSFPTNGTTIVYNATSTPALPGSLIKFRFFYTKSAGNISFDDLALNYNGGSSGCDSIITLHLTTNKPTTTNINLNGCKVTYKGITYTSSTIVRDTIKTTQGCDSNYNVANITIQNIKPITQNINLSSCDSVVYKLKVYKVSANFIDTLKSINNCDSIYNNVNITINYNFAGNIKHLTKGNISNVTVKLTSTASNTVLASGSYAFNCLTANSKVILRAAKNNDINKANGINTTDVLFVQRHILNTTKLNSAYKLIAADVNGDKLINSTDVLRLKRLILGTDTTFTKGSGINKIDRLWEFVDSAYQFPDTTNPFPFKDSISFTNLTSNKINQTFIGIKLGDVNDSWNAAVARAVATKPVELVYSIGNKQLGISNEELGIENSVVKVPITVSNFKEVAAMQYTLHFDNKNYEFVGIENNKLNIDFNEKQAGKNGNIAMLWTDKNAEPKTFEDGTELFVLVLRSTVDRRLSTDLQLIINNSITEIEAWDKDFQKHNIILSKRATINDKPETRNEWFTVSPNPTSGNVVVNLISKENKLVVFELSNVQGKMLYTQSFEAVKGNNTFKLNLKKKSNLPSGLYFLKANGTVQRIVINP